MSTKRNKRKRRLTSLEHVRRALADVFNRLDADELDGAKAGKLAYILLGVARIIDQNDLEARLTRLEELVRSKL